MKCALMRFILDDTYASIGVVFFGMNAASNPQVYNRVCVKFADTLTGTVVVSGHFMSVVYSQAEATNKRLPWPELLDHVQ